MISRLRAAVEVAGRLVGQQHGRVGDDRARDRDALLLAAGELVRGVWSPAAEPHLGQGLARAQRGAAPVGTPR